MEDKKVVDLVKLEKKTDFLINFLLVLLVLVVVGGSSYLLLTKDKYSDKFNLFNKSSNTLKVSLIDLSNAFNNLDAIKNINNTEGFNMNVSSRVAGNHFIIDITGPTPTTMNYTLNGSILSSTVKNSDELVGNGYYFLYLVEAKATALKEDVDNINISLKYLFNRFDYSNFTLAKDGFEILTNQDGSSTLSLDLNKYIPKVDYSSRYITLEELNQSVLGKYGDKTADTYSINDFAGDMLFYVKRDKNEIEIIIAEPKQFTARTSKSIFSFIEFFYGESEKNSFMSKYPALKDDKFDKYTITLNPKDEDLDHLYEDNMKVVKIDIVE